MRTSLRAAIGAAAVLLLATGCASKEPVTPRPSEEGMPRTPLAARLFAWTSVFGKIFPKKERPPRAVEPTAVGSIRQVNEENRFVLMDATSTAIAPQGAELIALSGERQTAVLRMTGLRSASFFIADILAGTPGTGDRVFRSIGNKTEE